MSDLLYAVQQVSFLPSFQHLQDLPPSLTIEDNWRCAFYLRFEALNRPGVLGHITTCLGQHEVSIESVVQRHTAGVERVPVVLLTHQAHEKDLRRALAAIDPQIAQIKGLLRIEGQDMM